MVTWARLRCSVVWTNTSPHVAEKLSLKHDEHFNQRAAESRSASTTLQENVPLGKALCTKEQRQEGRPRPQGVAVGGVGTACSFPPTLSGLPPRWPGATCQSGTELDCDTGQLLGADGMWPRQTRGASEGHASALF